MKKPRLIGKDYLRLSSFVLFVGLTLLLIFLWSESGLKALETKVFRTSLIIGQEGKGAGDLQQPSGLTVDQRGNIYVADTFNHRIQIFTAEGLFVHQFGGEGSEPGAFRFPKALALNQAGEIYVVDTGNHRVQKFSPQGDFLLQFGTLGDGEGELNSPGGLALDAEGNLYVADTQNHRIQKFTPEGKWLASWGSIGTEGGQFVEPTGIAMDAEGKIWVADTENHRLQRFTPTGQFLFEMGKAGKKPGELDSPRGLAIDAEGKIYVADTGNNRIQVFTPTGELLWVIGHMGRGEREFYYPTGVAVDKNGTLYVADTINHRIQRLTFSLPAAHLERGWKFYNAGKRAEAITQWQAALSLDPNFSPALFALGTALLEEGHFAQARDYFQTILRLDPEYSQARWRIYQSYLRQFRVPFFLLLVIIVACCAVWGTRYQRWRLLWHKAEEQRKKGDHRAAIPLYEKILTLRKNDLAAWKILEDLYQREGLETKRAVVNQMIAKLEPTNVSALSYLGKLFVEEENFTEAATVWRRVIEYNPAEREGYFYLGVVAAEQGTVVEAHSYFQQAFAPLQTAGDPSEGTELSEGEAPDPLQKLLQNWQDFFTRRPVYHQALQAFQTARLQMGQDHFARGKQLLEEGAFAEASAALRHAVTLVPEEQPFRELYIQAQSAFLFDKGMALYRVQHYAEAIPCFRKVLTLDPFHTEARKYLRYAQQCLEGDFNERFRQLDLREREK